MSRDWMQIRVRIPHELHAKIEAEALASGSTVQRELLVRIMRGSQEAARPVSTTRAYSTVKGELEVASKLISSLEAVVDQMKNAASLEADHTDHSIRELSDRLMSDTTGDEDDHAD